MIGAAAYLLKSAGPRGDDNYKFDVEVQETFLSHVELIRDDPNILSLFTPDVIKLLGEIAACLPDPHRRGHGKQLRQQLRAMRRCKLSIIVEPLLSLTTDFLIAATL